MSERWLPIPGYEGLYEISDLGRIRSLDREVWRKSRSGNLYPWTRPGCVMKQFRSLTSPRVYRQYWQIKLRDTNGVTKSHMVHRLVAQTFLGPCPIGQEVRHGPGGMLDNSLRNLLYGTSAENQADRVRDGTANIGSRNPMSKLTEEQVLLIRSRYEAGESQKALAEVFNISKSTISMIVNRKRWKG